MTEPKRACCTSPAAMCYWLAVSVIAWGGLSLIGIYWRPLRGLSAATVLFAMGIGCVGNWRKNRTLHCVMTAPLFLIAGAVFLLADVGLLHLNGALIWAFVLIGVGVAFVVEWRNTRGVCCKAPKKEERTFDEQRND